MVAGLFGLLDRSRFRAACLSATAAALAWACLLGWEALHGPVLPLARLLGGVMHLSAPLLLLVNLAFPALLAGATAACLGSLTAKHTPEDAR